MWYLPVAYFLVLGLLFTAFVRWNRKRQNDLKKSDAGYFGVHTERQIYLQLCEQYSPEEPAGKKVLTAALMKRAIQDVQRIWRIREEKPPLVNLVKQGAVGEDLLEKLLEAEREMDAEVQEVLEDAEMYRPGWKETIFTEASQILQRQVQIEAEQAAKQAQEEQRQLQAQLESNTEETEEITEERRKQLAAELIAEEEKEKEKQKSPTQSQQPKQRKKKK